jgi:predicted TPR repeat methyltransferase
VYFQLRELTSAAHHFREVTRLDPARAGAFVNLGAVLNLLGQHDDAVAALRRGIQLDAQRVEGYYNLGLVYRRKGQTDLAISAYKEAIRINPRMADAHLNLANLHLEKGQARQAAHHYELGLQIRPGWDKALDGLDHAKAAIAQEHAGRGPASGDTATGGSSAVLRSAPAGSDLDRPVDPVTHHAFLTSLHQTTIATEETGRLLQKIIDEEVEGALKELSTALLHSSGSRGELDTCLTKFETALNRMRSAHQALKTSITKVEEAGERLPGK